MKSEEAVRRLSALAQEARLDVFRLLVKAGPDGLAAGEIARKLHPGRGHPQPDRRRKIPRLFGGLLSQGQGPSACAGAA